MSSPYQRGYEARMNGEPDEPQGDLTISQNMEWRKGWEAADNADEAPALEESGSDPDEG